MTPFQLHVQTWKDCTACSLSQGRRKVVLCRGKLPCDILFIGEAPGFGEDATGLPFVGPAGKLLDEMVEKAEQEMYDDFEDYNDSPRLRFAFTNVVACIPRADEESKVNEPPPEAIKACRSRLEEMTKIANPRIVVAVGKVSGKFVHGKTYEIVHPAAILRANAASQGLMFQRTVVTLTEIFQSLRKTGR